MQNQWKSYYNLQKLSILSLSLISKNSVQSPVFVTREIGVLEVKQKKKKIGQLKVVVFFFFFLKAFKGEN